MPNEVAEEAVNEVREWCIVITPQATPDDVQRIIYETTEEVKAAAGVDSDDVPLALNVEFVMLGRDPISPDRLEWVVSQGAIPGDIVVFVVFFPGISDNPEHPVYQETMRRQAESP